MSHHSGQHAACPNCGYQASGNYCAQCGQETHLHADSFRALIMHFAGHYFHYDSKFWKTMKTLYASPGKLTKEYWEGKRARAIPPVSLYIFLSAVYFIASFSIGEMKREQGVQKSNGTILTSLRKTVDSLDKISKASDTLYVAPTSTFGRYLEHKLHYDTGDKGSFKKEFNEKLRHNFPKIFFVMIPLMALFLKLLFARRRQTFFVSHAIFSLHIHSFIFSLFLLQVLNPFYRADDLLTRLFFITSVIYTAIAMRHSYGISWGRAAVNTVVVTIGYLLFFLMAFLLMILLVAISN